MASQIMHRNYEIDVRPALPAISAPTLVVHSSGDPVVPLDLGRYLAEHIAGARFVELQGDFHASWRPRDIALWRDELLTFLGETGGTGEPASRILATVLFTDIVASTAVAQRLGDVSWHTLLDQHDRIVQNEIRRHGGQLIKTTGDGILATFEGPSRGVTCARALAAALRPLDLRMRAGLHTGEVELRGDDVTGMGVVIARRICDLAGADQVFVSRTVRDLVLGSDITLNHHGTFKLKGVPEEWQLFDLG